jgi:hypothetical protein
MKNLMINVRKTLVYLVRVLLTPLRHLRSLNPRMAWVHFGEVFPHHNLKSTYLAIGTLIPAPPGQLFLVTKYGARKMSHANAEAILARAYKARAILFFSWVLFIVVTAVLSYRLVTR